MMADFVHAKTIEQGQCFRKRNGTYAYLRISESAVKFHGLDQDAVYGVSYNGNMARVEADTLVEPVSVAVMAANQGEEDDWNRTFAREEI